ncbi:hypothetical protein [Vitiosangium sp. GDMCC 1.1324]|uniref:hypothetical protein n=1 Tax=Vitiosangium sp. (strain GDMCC 1.1324) TaxID=2138576 RepID=UPI000D393E24|nr:hypothetical protein [Vitiosangium sp. GDMCC 1.1324]PTL79317.1 hypothetical protein DAT35_34515 [Vitiosangium sp. GDMCC 1.1324]
MHALTALVMLLTAGSPNDSCFVPSDQTAGWKRVLLPEWAPALAAPADVDQFRTGEPVLLFEQDASAYTGAETENPGRMAYRFRVPRGARRLELGFLGDLRGAKVNAVAYASDRSFPLLDEKRLSGTQLALDWTMPDVDHVVVSVHHHLREKPVVRTWRVGRLFEPWKDPAVDPAFSTPHALYFRHPGGKRLELCNAPGRPLQLSRWPEKEGAKPINALVVPPHP